MSNTTKRYNSMYDIAFSFDHDYENTDDIPPAVLIAAALKRLARLLESSDVEIKEAFGECDTVKN
jgi:polysaccharide pyruvyl transferase WcaK-like protein